MTGLEAIAFRPVDAEIIITGIVLLVFLIMSGFVSGSEVAYFALTPQERERLEEKEKHQDATVLRLLEDPKRLLATILIANNMINVSIVMLSAYFSRALIDFGDSTIIRFIFETVIITSLILFIGEILPKIYSTQHHLSFARSMAYPLHFAEKIFSPFSGILMKSTNAMNAHLAKRQNVSADDLSQALELTSESMSDERDMLEGIVKFMELNVSDIMTPRMDVISINYESKFDEVLRTVVESGYSRMPVTGETPDDIKGIIYVKDILRDLGKSADHDWHPTMRKCYYVPETKKVNDLLTEFQSTKTHMAIIVDEYGCMQGIVTLEDIMEEIVGDISDEQDEIEKDWSRQPDGSYIFEAKILLNDFFKIIDTDGEEFEEARGEAETLAGMLLEINGLIPQRNDKIEIGQYKFEILSANNRRINKVKMTTKVKAHGTK